MHRHTAKHTTTRGYTGPVATDPAKQNPAAHGNIEDTETCACGAVRKVLINGKHVERSEWSRADENEDA